jgi:hypothetical protein
METPDKNRASLEFLRSSFRRIAKRRENDENMKAEHSSNRKNSSFNELSAVSKLLLSEPLDYSKHKTVSTLQSHFNFENSKGTACFGSALLSPSASSSGNVKHSEEQIFLVFSIEGKILEPKVRIKLYDHEAPHICKIFRKLCTGELGFGYSGSYIERIVPNFVIQGKTT